jgi:hypothetical protein
VKSSFLTKFKVSLITLGGVNEVVLIVLVFTVQNLTFSGRSAPFGTVMSIGVVSKVHQFVQSGI